MVSGEYRKSGADPLNIPVFGYRLSPGFIIAAYRYPAMDKAAFIRLDTPCYDVAHNKAGGEDNDPLAGQNVTVYDAAYGNKGPTYIAFHPGFFADYHPAFGVYIPADAAVYAGESPGFNAAVNAGSRPYDGID
jgi:hypothetical protein